MASHYSISLTAPKSSSLQRLETKPCLMNNNQGKNKNNMWVFTCENDTDIDDFISKPKKERDLEHYTIELNAYLLKEYLNSRDPLPPDLGRGFTYKQDSCTGWWGRGRVLATACSWSGDNHYHV